MTSGLHRPALRLQPALLALVLGVGTFAVFHQAISFGFLNYDDAEYVTENPVVLGGIGMDGIARAFRTPVMGNYHPVTMLSLAMDWHFFPGNAAAFHLANLLWHCANAVLAFALLRRIGCSVGAALFAAALFAWHPLRVESVVWIAERKDVLSGFFFLVTLLLYWRHLTGSKTQWARRIWFLGALGAFVVGLLCKPMLLTVPGVLLLLDLLHARSASVRSPSAWAPFSSTAELQSVLVGKIPFVLISVVLLVITLKTQRDIGATGPISNPLNHLPIALAAIPQYLAKTLWPYDLAPLYPYPQRGPVGWMVCGIATLLAGSAVCVWQWRRRPWLAIGWLWFLGMLVPVLGFVQAGAQAMADRYTYLPGLGLCLIAGLTLDESIRTIASRGRKLLLIAAAIAVVVAYAGATVAQVDRWRDPVTLWEHTVACTGPNPMGHFALGNAYAAEGRLAEAERELRTSVALAPIFFPARNNLGAVLARQGRTAEALAQWEIVAADQSATASVHLNLVRMLLAERRYDEAIAKCHWIAKRWPELPATGQLIAEAERQRAERLANPPEKRSHN